MAGPRYPYHGLFMNFLEGQAGHPVSDRGHCAAEPPPKRAMAIPIKIIGTSLGHARARAGCPWHKILARQQCPSGGARRELSPERAYRLIISSRLKCRPAFTWRYRFMRESTSCPLPACPVYCSSHLRNVASSVSRCERAISRACSIRFSSARKVTCFILLQCTGLSCMIHAFRAPTE
jgi:hypothetical protein